MQCSPTELIARAKGQNDISRPEAPPTPRRVRGASRDAPRKAQARYFTRKRRSLRELLSTLTEDRAMATAAYTGSSRMPNAG
jgi:hypothetical protein